MDEHGSRDPFCLELSRDWILSHCASSRFAFGDYLGALEDLNEVIRLGRIAGGESHSFRGQVRYTLGDLRGAIADLTEAVDLSGLNVNVSTRTAGHATDSTTFQELSPTSVVIRLRTPRYDPLAEVNGHFETNLELCNSYAYHAYSRFKAGDTQGADKDYHEARWHNFLYVLPLPPDRPDLGWIARFRSRIRDPHAFQGSSRLNVDVTTTIPDLLKHGIACLGADDLLEALKHLSILIKSNPNYGPAYAWRGKSEEGCSTSPEPSTILIMLLRSTTATPSPVPVKAPRWLFEMGTRRVQTSWTRP